MIKAVAVIIAVVGVLGGIGLGAVHAAACDVPIFAYRHGNVFFTEGGRVERVRVEVADTEDRLEVGLMCRPSLDPDAGMLFVFAAPTRASFWMKNTLIPLAIAFMDSDWHIVGILEMPVAQDPAAGPFPTYAPEKPYRYALEVNAGFFSKHDLDEHAQIRFAPQETDRIPGNVRAVFRRNFLRLKSGELAWPDRFLSPRPRWGASFPG